MGSNDAANAIELIKQIYTFAFDAYSDWLNLGWLKYIICFATLGMMYVPNTKHTVLDFLGVK